VLRDNARMIASTRYPLLARIDSPDDLKCIPEIDLPRVADELRAYLIESVASVGGHFGAAAATSAPDSAWSN